MASIEPLVVEIRVVEFPTTIPETPPARTMAAEDQSEKIREGKAIEDSVMAALEGRGDEWKATMYQQLNAEGMTLSKAHEIRRRARMTQ